MTEGVVLAAFWGALFSPLFWVALLVAFGVLIAVAEVATTKANCIGAAVLLLFMVGYLWFWAGIPILEWMYHHPWKSMLYVGSYIALGVLWSMFKYDRYTKKCAAGEAKLRAEFFNAKFDKLWEDYGKFFDETPKASMQALRASMQEAFAAKRMTPELADLYVRWNENGYSSREIFPTWQRNKDKIAAWALWWPMSAFWWFGNHFLVNLFYTVTGWFRGLYERVAMRHYADADVLYQAQEKRWG